MESLWEVYKSIGNVCGVAGAPIRRDMHVVKKEMFGLKKPYKIVGFAAEGERGRDFQ